MPAQNAFFVDASGSGDFGSGQIKKTIFVGKLQHACGLLGVDVEQVLRHLYKKKVSFEAFKIISNEIT